MEIIPRRHIQKMVESQRAEINSLEGCILEINRQISGADSDTIYVSIQAVLSGSDFGSLLGYLHVAGYNPSWEKLEWNGESGEFVYNVRVPLDEERDKFTCSNCGDQLTPLHFFGGDGIQFKNALALGFFGGYGMYLEDRSPSAPTPRIPGATTEAILCENCVVKLAQAFPALGNLLSTAPQY